MTDSSKFLAKISAFAAVVFFAFSAPSFSATGSLTAKSMGSFTRIEVKNGGGVSVAENGDTVVINFPSGNAPNPKSLGSGIKRVSESIVAGPDNKSLTINLNGEYKIRQFIGNRGAGFDLFEGSKKPRKTPVKKEPELAEKTEPAKTEQIAKPEQPSEQQQKTETKPVEPAKQEKNTESKAENAPPSAPEPTKIMETKSLGEVPAETPQAINNATSDSNQLSDIQKAEKAALQAASPAKPAEPANTPEPKYEQRDAESSIQQNVQTMQNSEAKPLADFRESETIFKISPKSTYAVYERNGNIWVFIDNSAAAESDSSPATITENTYPAEWLQANYGSTTLFWSPMDANSTVTSSVSDGNLAVVFSKDQQQKPFQAGIYSYQQGQEAQASALKINFLPPYGINKITDPIVGDNLLIISGELPSAANKRVRGTVEIKVLKSYSGLAIVANLDDLAAEPVQDGVLLKSPTPFVSTKGLLVDSEKPSTRIEHRQSFAPAADWLFPDGSDYITSRHENNFKFMNSPRDSRPYFRLRGAQDFISSGMFSEALGLLKTIKPDTPEFYKKNKLAGLSAVLNLFLGRNDDALADLAEPEIKDTPEAQHLSKLAALLSGKPEGDAFKFPEAYSSFVSSYPPRIQKRMAEMVLRNYYTRNKLSEAEGLIKYLKEEKIITDTDPQKKLLDYIDSKLTEAGGDISAAQKIWEALAADLKDREFRAKAQFELIKRAYINGTTSRIDTLQKYNNLRFTWREEDFEVPLLDAIANLAMEEKDYYASLESMRYMITYYPSNELSKKAIEKMSSLFVNLFNNGGVAHMNALDALTLYYEFRELTPLGEVGDEMIRNLADRLMEVDLLDRASALLTHQIRFRLEGLARAQVATRLALIHVMNNKPQNAIEVLDFSNMEGLPSDLTENRKLIRAQAQMDLKKYDDALITLAGDTSEKADELRLETLWNAKMWNDVAKHIEPQLEEAAKAGKPFNEKNEQKLIRLAVAYILNANSKAAQELEPKYARLVTSEDLKRELQFLASDPEGVDHNGMDKLSGAIQEFESFMDNFKKKVKDQGLSKAVP